MAKKLKAQNDKLTPEVATGEAKTAAAIPAPSSDKAQGGAAATAGAEVEGKEHALETLNALAQHICRIRNRRIMFGGDKDHVVANGAEGMCGLLVAEVLEFLRINEMPNLPSQADIAEEFGLNAGTFSQFLAGQPSRNKAWVSQARECIRFIVRTTTP
jgi:hypothetical protein